MIKGEVAAEADIFCDEVCQYLLFMVDGKPTYVNALSTNGINFFQNILKQVDQQVGQ